jgi:VWFA-related protein
MKKTRAPLTLLLSLCSLFALALAQQPTQTPTPAPTTTEAQRERQQSPPSSQPAQKSPSSSQSPPPAPRATLPVTVDEDEVVRITTNLVQLDVLVTDKKGKQVTNLKPEDFQVLEDGKPQKITNFSYVTTESPTATPGANIAAAPKPKPDKNAPPVPPAPPRKLRPEQVRRTIALVVDDLSISFADMPFVQRALRKYVDKYVGDGDLVAILRTSAGAGATQQFTSDRRILYAEVAHVRPYLAGNGGMSVFAPVGHPETGINPKGNPGSDDENPGRGGSSSRSNSSNGGKGANQKDELDNLREEYFAVGTLGALRYVVNGMRELPGRKSIILFSPGFRLVNPDDSSGRTDRALIAARYLVDQANRASVVIYTVDPRGLVYTGITASDDVSGMSPQAMMDLMNSRDQELFETQSGSSFLAEQTGGLDFKNSNDILPAARILEDLRGYYLIGYRPQGETFNRRFHTLSAKLLNHPELRVRARKGFYGITTEELRPAIKRTREQQFVAALLSPISAGDVHVRLTALFTNTEKAGSLVGAQLQVDANDLQFAKQADGTYLAKLDVIGVTFADTGAVVDQRGITQTLKLPEELYQRAVRAGILYTINVPVKKPGAYQLRVALRDNANDHVGSASQFIEVPDLKKNRLAISGVVMSGAPPASLSSKSGGSNVASQAAGAREGEVETSDPQSSSAVRRFHPRQTVDYACVIFNPQTDKAHAQPQLTARVELYRDGVVVFTGKEQTVPLNGQIDLRRVIYAGRLTLGANLAPGDYALQVVVTDQQRADKYRVASQWIDFEIVE